MVSAVLQDSQTEDKMTRIQIFLHGARLAWPRGGCLHCYFRSSDAMRAQIPFAPELMLFALLLQSGITLEEFVTACERWLPTKGREDLARVIWKRVFYEHEGSKCLKFTPSWSFGCISLEELPDLLKLLPEEKI